MGCDHAAYGMKETIKTYLSDKGVYVKDVGTDSKKSVDYPDFGLKVASAVSNRDFKKGILLCGTGLGMTIVANRFSGVRAALCNDIFSSIMSRKHNDSNILVMGGRVI